MLGSAEIARVVAETLAARAAGIPLVVDPVMVSTSGAALADDGAIEILKSALIPLATLVTPNIPEAEALCGFPLSAPDDLMRAGERLLSLGARAVLLKGGHGGADTVSDFLFTPGESPRVYIAKRVATRHTHGTGCTLATAIACGLGQDMPLGDAIQRAHDFVQAAIRTAPGFGAGNGPINLLR